MAIILFQQINQLSGKIVPYKGKHSWDSLHVKLPQHYVSVRVLTLGTEFGDGVPITENIFIVLLFFSP